MARKIGSRIIDAFAVLADGKRVALNLHGERPETLTLRGEPYALRWSKDGVAYYTAGVPARKVA